MGSSGSYGGLVLLILSILNSLLFHLSHFPNGHPSQHPRARRRRRRREPRPVADVARGRRQDGQDVCAPQLGRRAQGQGHSEGCVGCLGCWAVRTSRCSASASELVSASASVSAPESPSSSYLPPSSSWSCARAVWGHWPPFWGPGPGASDTATCYAPSPRAQPSGLAKDVDGLHSRPRPRHRTHRTHAEHASPSPSTRRDPRPDPMLTPGAPNDALAGKRAELEKSMRSVGVGGVLAVALSVTRSRIRVVHRALLSPSG